MFDLTKLSIEALKGIRSTNLRAGHAAAVRELTEEINHRAMERNALGTFIGCKGNACMSRVAEIMRASYAEEIQGV